MTKLKVACAGAGYFSQFHHNSWARMERVSLVGVCDQDVGKAQATGLPAFDDLAKMISDTSPDVMDIILPPQAHAPAIQTALNMGVRWIICQKPFCTTLEEAQEITQAAETAGATLLVHENFRFQPWYRAIKASIDRGDVGKVLQATFRLRPGDGQGREAYLNRQPYFQKMDRFLVHETAVHWVDTFRYLFGDPTSVYADLRRINPHIAGEDAGVILFDHPNGVQSMFDGNRHLDHGSDNLRRTMGEAWIEGTKGTLSLSGDGAVHLRPFGQSGMSQILPPDSLEGFGGDCVHAFQSHVVAAILDGAPLETKALDYLQVQRIEAAIYASADRGQKVHLALKEWT